MTTNDDSDGGGHVAAAEKDLERFMVKLDDKSAAAMRRIMVYLGATTRPAAIRWALIKAARNLRLRGSL